VFAGLNIVVAQKPTNKLVVSSLLDVQAAFGFAETTPASGARILAIRDR
jgi:hypothetical protein